MYIKLGKCRVYHIKLGKCKSVYKVGEVQGVPYKAREMQECI